MEPPRPLHGLQNKGAARKRYVSGNVCFESLCAGGRKLESEFAPKASRGKLRRGFHPPFLEERSAQDTSQAGGGGGACSTPPASGSLGARNVRDGGVASEPRPSPRRDSLYDAARRARRARRDGVSSVFTSGRRGRRQRRPPLTLPPSPTVSSSLLWFQFSRP